MTNPKNNNDAIMGGMTNWYDPTQLKDTAKKTILSTAVGTYADPREGAADPSPGKFFDYTKRLVPSGGDFAIDESSDRPEIWIDYAADVGDGWNSTYAVAYNLAGRQITPDDASPPLPRGEILFFGGDGVYPTANENEYEKRLVNPYRMAFRCGAASTPADHTSDLTDTPHVFALPGNHDWYDSLVSFRRLFCSHIFNNRKFAAESDTGRGGWSTRQKRSYFALKLPHKWWLLAVDLQLTHNIDVSQLVYFESVIANMEAGDKIILCVPEPYWVKYIKYQDVTDKFEEKERSIEKLERLFADRGVAVRAYIAGDLHHYRRFEDADGTQKITAGGGGAFLHPTHDFNFKEAGEKAGWEGNFKGFRLKGEYPDYEESRAMDWKNLKFLSNNKTFGLLTAAIYFILALLIRGDIKGQFSWYEASKATANRLIEEPLALLVIVSLVLGLIFFTDSNSKTFKRVGGALHGGAHLLFAFIFGWLGYLLAEWVCRAANIPQPSTRYNLVWFLSVLVVSSVGGYVVGSILMGLYLIVSLRWRGRHANEAFSAMKIEDYRNFLRLHIGPAGELTIYPIKIETVPRKWKPNKSGGDVDYFTPEDGSPPALIESPIRVT